MLLTCKNVIDELNSVHRNFIYNSKKPKIKHSTLIADCEEGGYKDVDIKSKILSFKVCWISKLLDANFHPYKIIPNQIFSEVGGAKIIFHFNFKLSKQCPLQGKNLPRFYNELVRTWSDVSENDPKEVLEIFCEVLWNNENNESLYNQYLIDKGVVTLGGTISDKREILTWEEVRRKYSLSSHYVLNWLDLVNCIPKKWKDKLKSSHKENTSDNLRLTNKKLPNFSSKYAYQKLVKSLIKPPTTRKVWEKLLSSVSIEW